MPTIALRNLVVALCLGAFLAPSTAQAAKPHFGPSEKLHVIAGTKLLNGAQPLSLCYKSYTYFFLAGIFTTDEYVLCEGGASDRYWPMPAGEELAKLQSEGLLPSPLPPYERDTFDYVIGYSLWLVIAFVVLWGLVDRLRAKGRNEKARAQLKTTLRRVMARVVLVAGDRDRAVAKALEIYQGVFREPLPEADFLSDVAWVAGQPTTFNGFVGAMGRKFAANAKPVLIHAAAAIALDDGIVSPEEDRVLRDLATKLGFSRKEADAFVDALHKQPSAAPADGPTLTI